MAARSHIYVARAILAGQPIPEGYRWGCDWETPFKRRTKELVQEPPSVTYADFAKLYPDDEEQHDNPEDAEITAEYNALSPAERAMDFLFATLDGAGLNERDVRDPIYLYEIRLAQRRTLERLLDLADQEVTRADR